MAKVIPSVNSIMIHIRDVPITRGRGGGFIPPNLKKIGRGVGGE